MHPLTYEHVPKVTRLIAQMDDGMVLDFLADHPSDSSTVDVRVMPDDVPLSFFDGPREIPDLARGVRVNVSMRLHGPTVGGLPLLKVTHRASVCVGDRQTGPLGGACTKHDRSPDAVDYRFSRSAMPSLAFVTNGPAHDTVHVWTAGTGHQVPEDRRARALLRAMLDVARDELDAAEAADRPDNDPGTAPTDRSTRP